ncbi:hypothetical protein JCM14036_08720 [Desulfotomaculum defluvii]
MRVQLIEVSRGIAAAAWQNGQLEALTLPHINTDEAIVTLGDYLKMDSSLFRLIDDLDSYQLELERAVSQYFEGKPVTFNMPLNWDRLTPFQGKVLKVVKNIPYGTTMSYGEIGQVLGYRSGARAVGGAVGANPWLLVVPCHRVLAANKGLGGFSSGLGWKEVLLQIEKIQYKTSDGK